MLRLEIPHFGLEVISTLSVIYLDWYLVPHYEEWGLSTQFAATEEFLPKWADAQKYSYSKGAGWIVRNFIHFKN